MFTMKFNHHPAQQKTNRRQTSSRPIDAWANQEVAMIETGISSFKEEDILYRAHLEQMQGNHELSEALFNVLSW